MTGGRDTAEAFVEVDDGEIDGTRPFRLATDAELLVMHTNSALRRDGWKIASGSAGARVQAGYWATSGLAATYEAECVNHPDLGPLRAAMSAAR